MGDASQLGDLERAARDHWARLLAILVAQFRRIELAEDSLQDAFAAAVRTWPRSGVPANPSAWLLTAARRRGIDRLRAEGTAARKLQLLEASVVTGIPDPQDIADERLRLIFFCCHPALPTTSAAAATLRLVGGLTVAEIARLFLVTTPTMAARITRAKRRLAAAPASLDLPALDELGTRLDAVLAVIYLMFTEGYSPTAGAQLIRTDLAAEAIRLGRTLDRLLPSQPAVQALLALMLFQHSRRDARIDHDGRLVLLPDQDRTAWRGDEIEDALARLRSATSRAAPVAEWPAASARYLIEARIAAQHATATTAADTDWSAIAALYGELEDLTGSPVVRLNRAIAVAEADGAAAGLDLLDGLDESLPASAALATARGELLDRAGRRAEAAASLAAAIDLATNEAERAHLRRRLAAVTESSDL